MIDTKTIVEIEKLLKNEKIVNTKLLSNSFNINCYKLLLSDNKEYVVKNIPKYNLTKGINEKKYRSISEQVINQIPTINDWLDENYISKHNLLSWNESIDKLT